MSWHYLQEQGEEFLEAPSWDGGVLERWKSNLMQEESYWSDNGTEFLNDSQSGTTLEHSKQTTLDAETILNSCAELEVSLSSLEVFRVRTLALRERERELKEIEAGYGLKCRESFAKLDHDSFTWRTHQPCLFEGLSPFLENWPRWGMMRNGECWERLSAVPRTEEKGFGFMPTPTASDHKRFPMKSDYANRPITLGVPDDLAKWAVRKSGLAHARPEPVLWEWAMAWPENWTELKPLGMVKFQSWLQRHGIF